MIKPFILQWCGFSTNKGGQLTLVLFSHRPNKAFMMHYSRRATDRNGNSICADVTDDSVENN